jgi:anthranilate synthase/aminodeoxychorismate synthase-like glutamine amidotransferase
MIKVLLIDNYDSFTYNIAHYFNILHYQVDVVKNDTKLLKKIQKLDYTHVVLSPGPGFPAASGYTFEVIRNIYKRLPVLGVCLGHQCLANFFGAKIVHARQVMHGKISIMYNDGSIIFSGLPPNFRIVRYHSLIIDPRSLPPCLQVTGWTQDHDGRVDEIMAVQHRDYNLFGMQYHPEAALSEYGLDCFKNFIEKTKNDKS